jgi:hypothetical protein
LPNFLALFRFTLPLLTDDLGNVGVVETRVASNDSLLVVLPIEDKCCKGWSADCAIIFYKQSSILCSDSDSGL